MGSPIPLLRSTLASLLLSLVACGGGHSKAGETTTPDAAVEPPIEDAGNPVGEDAAPSPPSDDAAPPAVDAGAPVPVEAGYPSDPTDGPPTRQACTNKFGSAVTAVHGRLDGTLVSIVQPGVKSCNGDTTHLHLQLSVNGAVYDVATNLDTYVYEQDMAIPDNAYAEGWHTNDALDYPTLGIHSTQFTLPASQAELAQTLTSALENANHLSVFAMGYGPTGIHDVHRKGNNEDGAIVIDPLSPTSHVFFFRFDTDSF